MEVLDDDIRGPLLQTQTLAVQDALVPNTNNRLVAADDDAHRASLVVRDLNRGLLAVAVGLDPVLAAVEERADILVAAAHLGDASLGADEVEGLVNANHAGGIIPEP